MYQSSPSGNIRTIGISTVYQRGKTQVPSEVRKVLKLKDGDKIVWDVDDNSSRIMVRASLVPKGRFQAPQLG